MNIVVLLSPIHFFSLFLLFRNIIYKSKITIFSLQKKIIIISFFKKTNKVSTINFTIVIKGISGRVEMCKYVISSYIPTYQPIRKLNPCNTRSVRMVLP